MWIILKFSVDSSLEGSCINYISSLVWVEIQSYTSRVCCFLTLETFVTAVLCASRTGRLSTNETWTICKAFRLPLPENLLGGLLSK